MHTRDFLLVGAGAIVGYFLADKMNKNKAGSSVGTISLPNTSSQTVPPAEIQSGNDSTGTPAPVIYGIDPSQPRPPKGQETLVEPRLTLYEENWNKYAQTKRFGSAEQAQTTHDNFVTSCLAKLQ